MRKFQLYIFFLCFIFCISIFICPTLKAQLHTNDIKQLFYTRNISPFQQYHTPIHPNTQKAFFCRIEDKFNSKTRIPMSFRLGSLAYCNKIEYQKYLIGNKVWN